MQTCYNCGKEVDDNVLICPDCGALVKRYGKPVREEAAESSPSAFPGAFDPSTASPRPAPGEAIWLDERGRPHFRGVVCFWLILCVLWSGYMVMGFGCILLVYHAQEFFLGALEAMPELAEIGEVLKLMIESVGLHYAYYVALPILFALKFAGVLLLLISHRRTAFYLFAGASAVLCLLNFVLGGGAQALIYVLDAALTGFLLRRSWKKLRP